MRTRSIARLRAITPQIVPSAGQLRRPADRELFLSGFAWRRSTPVDATLASARGFAKYSDEQRRPRSCRGDRQEAAPADGDGAAISRAPGPCSNATPQRGNGLRKSGDRPIFCSTCRCWTRPGSTTRAKPVLHRCRACAPPNQRAARPLRSISRVSFACACRRSAWSGSSPAKPATASGQRRAFRRLRFSELAADDKFLVTAETAFGAAIGYDWLYHSLTERERKEIARAIVEKAIEPGLDAVRHAVKTVLDDGRR